MLRLASVPQTDEEDPAGPSTSVDPRCRAQYITVGALGVLLLVAYLCSPPLLASSEFSSEFVSLQGVQLPTLPPSPVDQFKANLSNFRDKWGINNQRKDQIALCVINLNLGFWKLVQWSTILTEATNNCPAGFYDMDKKMACNINLAAVFAPLSASIGLFSSTAFLCPGRPNPDAACASTFGATFEMAAKFAASPNQISLFCPKASQKEFAKSHQTVYMNERRLASNSSHSQQLPTDSNHTGSAEDRKLYIVLRNPTEPNADELKNTFCTWQIAQSILFAMRAGPLIEISTKLCPPPAGGTAACSQIINEIMLMFWNVGKFIAAAAANCVKGADVAAGCALGSLNLVSAFSALGSVTSSLADGVCTDLPSQKRAARDQRINQKIRKIMLLESISLRRLLREKKLTGLAVEEASKRIAQRDPGSNATVMDLLHSLGLHAESAHTQELVQSHLRSLKSTRLEESERQQMFAKARALLAKYDASTVSKPPFVS